MGKKRNHIDVNCPIWIIRQNHESKKKNISDLVSCLFFLFIEKGYFSLTFDKTKHTAESILKRSKNKNQ